MCRAAFSEFDAEIVANLTDKQMMSISSEYGIDISKVRGVVDNANQILQVNKMCPFHHSSLLDLYSFHIMSSKYNSLRELLVEKNRIVNCFFPLLIILFLNSLFAKKGCRQVSSNSL